MRNDTTRLSSKGQVVIPAWVRRQLRLSSGEELRVEIAAGGERAVILRGSTLREIERRLEKGYEWIERTGTNLVEALHEARRKARLKERRRRST